MINLMQPKFSEGEDKDSWRKGDLRGRCSVCTKERESYGPTFIKDVFHVKPNGFSLEADAATVLH